MKFTLFAFHANTMDYTSADRNKPGYRRWVLELMNLFQKYALIDSGIFVVNSSEYAAIEEAKYRLKHEQVDFAMLEFEENQLQGYFEDDAATALNQLGVGERNLRIS